MSITVDTMLDQLESDLELKLNSASGYNTDIKVVRGIVTPPELGGYLPIVGFTLTGETFEMAFEGNDINTHLELLFYGYSETAGLDKVTSKGRNNAGIHELAHDVMYFLFNEDWTYSSNTVMTDNEIKYFEGGLQNPISVFMLEVKIQVDSSATTLKD